MKKLINKIMQSAKVFLKTAIGYVRSYKKEKLNYLSPADQEKTIMDYAQKYGYRILKVFKEENVSGRDFERPAFEEMLEYIKQNPYKVKFLLVTDSKRLSSNVSGLVRFRWFLRKKFITLISITKSLIRDAEKQRNQQS